LPIRCRLLAALSGLIVLSGPMAAKVAAKDFPVAITAARVGLPSAVQAADQQDANQSSHISKFAAWTPIYLNLQISEAISGSAEIVVQAPDPDEINTTLAVPLNLSDLKNGAQGAASAMAYVRPGGIGEITVFIRSAGGGKPLSEPFRVRSLRPRDRLSYVVLTLGPHIPGFELPKPITGTPEQMAPLRGGRIEHTELTDVSQLPERWFGYDSVDVAILNTAPGSNPFIERIFGDQANPGDKAKREALLEWVRRGGRLVVTVGGNAGLVARLPALQELLPFAVNPALPSRSPGIVELTWGARESTSITSTLSGALGSRSDKFPVANLVPKPERPAWVVIPTKDRLKDLKDALAVQAPYGLGRVTLVAFDLDRSPFTEFTQRPEFWDWVLREGGAKRASAGSEGRPKPGATGSTEEEDEVAVSLRTHIDTFHDIPVVSFGWVAILLVLYIILIGPIEYFFLKQVLGRLELTWITFPIIVLTVSLATCFTAYSLKGRELRINKVDVVDVDPASNRIYGTTWFTIFSPRIETYTLGVSPAEGWSDENDPKGTTVNWLGAPRGGRPSLLRRSYQYHEDAAGLEKVPVQVWSTKSFVANWSSKIANEPAGQSGNFVASTLVESRLEHPPADRTTAIGTFVNRLPIPVLSDCVAFYAGQAYPIPGGTIRSGETIRLVLDKGMPANQWLQKESRLEEVLRRVPSYFERPSAGKAPPLTPEAQGSMDDAFPFWGALFHESSLTYAEGVIARNASLRWLDQSWRLDQANQGQVILIGRVAPQIGRAEETLSGPRAASLLWLKGIPGTGETRTSIPGTGRQETWVRVYLPVKSYPGQVRP
jgi:hypothetical protein